VEYFAVSQVLISGLVIDVGAVPTYSIGEYRPVSIDTTGAVLVNGAGGGGAVVVDGSDTPADDRPNPTRNVAVTGFNEYWSPIDASWFRVACIDINNQTIPQFPEPFYALTTYAVAGGFDELTNTYSVLGQRSPTDAMPNPGADFILPVDVLSRSMLWDAATELWRRAQVTALNVDIAAATAFGEIVAAPGYFKRDAGNWIANPGDQITDATAAPGVAPLAGSLALLFDGTNWLRARGDANGSAQTIATPPPATGGPTGASIYGSASATVTTGSIKASAGKLLALHLATSADAPAYFQLYNTAAAPTAGAAAVHSIALSGSYQVVSLGLEFFGETGEAFATGIAWGISRDPAVYQSITNVQTSVNARYV
jgi:hypothetical protein